METKVLIIGLLLLQLSGASTLVLAGGGRERLRPPQSAEYYNSKIAALQEHDPKVARTYADSMLMAASAASDSVAIGEAMKQLGDLHVTTGHYAQAVRWYHKGLALANARRDRILAVRIHANLGRIYLKTGHYDKALSQSNKAYSLGRNVLSPDQKATVLNNLGLIYKHLNQYQQAEMYLLDALEMYKSTGNTTGTGQVYNNLGLLAKDLKQLQKAKEYYLRAKQISLQVNRPTGTAYALNNLASVFLEEGQPAKALPLLYASMKIKKQLGDKMGMLNSHDQLGQTWLVLQQPDSALYHYQASSLYADTLSNVEKKIEALTGLAKAYELKGRREALAPLYAKILTLKDSSFHQERAAQFAMAQAELEMDKKDEAIQVLTEEAKEVSTKVQFQEILLFVLLPLLVLLVVFTVFYLLRYKSERKAHHELQRQHQEIQQQKEQIEQQHQIIQHQNTELQDANKLIEHYNAELKEVNERLEDKIRERTRALSDTYRKLSFHINNTPLAVLEWNKKLELVRWPEQAQKIFGYTAHQMLGRSAEELPILQDSQHMLFLQSIRQGEQEPRAKQVSFQQELQHADGHPLCVEWSHSVLTDDAGEVESVLSIANDVSLREKAFQEISLINQELDTFIYKASHDLRGPIARMQGIINLGKIESADPKAHFYFELLNRVSNELNNLLVRLLMVHNIHQHMLCLERVSFQSFVDSLIYELPNQKLSQNFTFYNHIPENLSVESDKSLLAMILMNLLDNSLTFADNEKPFVVISAKVLSGKKLLFSVQDNGPGISDSMHEKVFDMFFQGSTKSTGVGLGLYMVRKAVRKFGGEVKLERLDGLTTFTVILPESDMMRIVHTPKKAKASLA